MEDIIKTVDETHEFDVLFWVGSMGSYDIRSQRIARSFTRLMHKAGVKFAILGNEEGELRGYSAPDGERVLIPGIMHSKH